MKIWKEFREFAFKGNVMDMAVGVMIGAAFGGIVTSLVNDLITPLLSVVTGKVDLSTFSLTLGEGESAPVFAYGNFIQTVINFLIVAVCIFALVKFVNKLKRHEPPKEPAPKCPYCKGEIASGATRCPHCTSALEGL